MAKTTKRRKPKKQPPPVSAKAKIYKRKRTFSEKAIMVLGIFIALSMILALVSSLISSSPF
jgi:cell division protein FtsL